MLILSITNIILWSGVIFQKGIIIQRDFNFPLLRQNFVRYHYPIWNDLMSKPNIESFPRLPLRLPFILLAKAGVSIPVILKIMLVTTYIFVSFAMYLFLKELLKRCGYEKNKWISFVGALFFAYSPVSLQFSGEIVILFSAGTLPLLLYITLKYYPHHLQKFAIYSSVILLFSPGHPFTLIINFILFFLFLIFLNDNLSKSIKHGFIVGVLFSLLFAWYALPYFCSGAISAVELGRSKNYLEAFKYVSENNIFKILSLERDKFNYVRSFPEGGLTYVFHILGLSLILIIAFSNFFYKHHITNLFLRKTLFLASTGYLLTSLFAFGAKTPFGKFYYLLVTSIPFGWILRSPLKFQLYQAFFLSILFTLGITSFNKFHNKTGFKIAPILIIIILMSVSYFGILDANFNSLNPINLPQAFWEMNLFLKKQKNNFKVIWYPKYNETPVSWSQGHQISPFDIRCSGKSTYDTQWNYSWITENLGHVPIKLYLFKNREFYKLLSKLGIGYIALHGDQNQKFYRKTKRDIERYTTILYDKKFWLLGKINNEIEDDFTIYLGSILFSDQDISKMLPFFKLESVVFTKSFKNLTSFKNLNASNQLFTIFPIIKQKGWIYKEKKINPTKYIVKLNAISSFLLVFKQTYDPNWQAIVLKDTKQLEVVHSRHVYSVINGFWIDQTGDLEIVIRYKPQDWFEIGLVISALTFIGCIGYLIYDWRKNKKLVVSDRGDASVGQRKKVGCSL